MEDIEVLPNNRLELYQYFPKQAIGAEVGVHAGKNAIELHKIAEPRLLHLIDSWPEGTVVYDGLDPGIDGFEAMGRVSETFKGVPGVLLHRGISWDVLETFPDGYFDWAYLDTSHEMKDTLKELEVLGRKVNGIIAGHDYCNEFPGVVIAVNQFIRSSDWYLKFLTYGERWNSFGLARRK